MLGSLPVAGSAPVKIVVVVAVVDGVVVGANELVLVVGASVVVVVDVVVVDVVLVVVVLVVVVAVTAIVAELELLLVFASPVVDAIDAVLSRVPSNSEPMVTTSVKVAVCPLASVGHMIDTVPVVPTGGVVMSADAPVS